MKTAQPQSSDKQHTSHGFTLFNSQSSIQPENYPYHKNNICVMGGSVWKAVQMHFLPILSGGFFISFLFSSRPLQA
jgi:hypothetical protein